MRKVVLRAARLVLLGGPTAIAFFAGGYFAAPRAVAGLVAWILVAVGMLLEPEAVPRSRLSWITLGGLLSFSAWTLLSITWAPVAGDAYHAGQIVMLYLGVVIAAAVLLRSSAAQQLVEPVLAAGTLVVIGYGISERLLPGWLHFSVSVSAAGRLEQPLTYWNAMGELAALGIVLSARLAGDWRRPTWLRVAGAVSCVPLGLGLYLSFSRGALFACAAGLLTLVIAVRRREQLLAVGLVIVAGGVAAAASSSFAGVSAMTGSIGSRESDGAIVLALLVVIMLLTGLGQWLLISRRTPAELELPRKSPVIAAIVICAALALAIVVGSKESSVQNQPLSTGATRLVTLQSNRYDYWTVAIKAFGQHPLNGVGAGNWKVDWLRYRHISEFANDAHSLPLQTLAETGLVGLGLLLVFLGGVAVVAARTIPLGPLAAGPAAGFTAYVAHAPLDWDWQMPAVTLIALVLAGALIAVGDVSGPRRRIETGDLALTSVP